MTVLSETVFEKYLKRYIKLLTNGTDEFFIAIVDIDKHLVKRILENTMFYPGCAVAWFERKDYAEAVRLRNDKNISKIVLLSVESVKMIDSLKDFVEYPVIPDNRDILWNCLEEAYGHNFDSDSRRILEGVMDYKQIAIEDLLDYLNSWMNNARPFDTGVLTRNLYYFGIWMTKKSVKDVTKLHLQKMVKHSEQQLVETKLMGGIAEGKKFLNERLQKRVVGWLSKNNFREIYKEVDYEKVKDLFKGNMRTSEDTVQEKSEEQSYEHSYEYAIQEQEIEDMESLEDRLMEEAQESVLAVSFEQFHYPDDIYFKNIFRQLSGTVEEMNFTKRKQAEILGELKAIQEACEAAVSKGHNFTPAYLFHYVQTQDKFIELYFKFLGKCVADESIAQTCIGTGFLNAVQNIFCTKKNNEIQMPFYHPMVGFYYSVLRRKYDEVKEQFMPFEDDFIREAVNALIDKEQLDFPVRYMFMDNQLYQLDYTCLKEWTEKIIFTRVDDYITGSWVDVRLLNEDLMNYIERQRFLTEIKVTIVDINDIREMMSMIEKLRRASESNHSMVNKVVLNIVSSKEDELKRQLQERMEMDIDYPQVLFRFARELYMRDGYYDLNRMIADSDLMFLADGNILYQLPKLVAWKGDANWLKYQFEQLSLQNLLDMNNDGNGSQLEVLWDSIHYIEKEEAVRIACWNTQELRQPLLSDIRRAVDMNAALTIVIMSSNRQLLQHIYHIKGFQVRKSVMSGREMLMVSFHQGSIRRLLQSSGEAKITIAIIPFIEEVLGIHDMQSILYSDKSEENPCLTIRYEDGSFGFLCELIVKDDLAYNEERRQHYIQLAEDIFKLFSLSRIFKEKLIAVLFEQAENYKTALMIDYMKRKNFSEIHCEYVETLYTDEDDRLADSVDVLAFQGMMEFIRKQNLIDEYSVNHFCSIYRQEMLEGCLTADQALGFLDADTKQKMKQLYNKMEKMYE